MEIWKDVLGYEGYYQVSNLGRVKSLDRVVLRKGHNMNLKGKIIKPQLNEFGYQMVVLIKMAKSKSIKIHQLVANAFIPNPENLPCINHKDGLKRNNHATNLEWCTYSQNHKHAYDMGLKKPYERNGEKNPKAKFTNEEVTQIRRIHKHVGTAELASKYGVHVDTITNMIKRKTYCLI